MSSAMIKRARELAGIDQRELALLVGLSRRTVVSVESEMPGKIDPRRRAVLERIRATFAREFAIECEPETQKVWRRRRRASRPIQERSPSNEIKDSSKKERPKKG
jgi:DNA-binding XRE family transcriptional regulator